MRKIAVFCALALASFPALALVSCKGGAKRRCQVQIEAEYFAEGRLEAEMRVCVVNNTENALHEIPFALYGNAFCEDAEVPPVSDLFSSACYYEGDSFGQMEIVNVEGGDFCLYEDKSLLTVDLYEPLYPDESVELTISYTLTLARANHRLGVGEHCINLSYFYPMLFAQTNSGFYEYTPASCGDPFTLDLADFLVVLTVPEEYSVACGGEVEQRTESGKNVVTYQGEGVREAAFVLGDFSKVSAVQNDVTVDYYYFADENADNTLQAACKAIATYSELFTAYPYKRFALAESDLFLGGMEYSGFVMISALLSKKERVEVVAHEAAHQWWYGLVGSNQAECAWQDEGLAQYCVALFYEQNPDYGQNYRELIASSEGAYRNYFSVKSQLSKEVDTSMSRPLASFAGDYEYRVLAYDKGVVLFDRLRSCLGNRRFFAALAKYAKTYAGCLATQYDLIGCFPTQEALCLSFVEGRCVI